MQKNELERSASPDCALMSNVPEHDRIPVLPE